MSQPSELHRPTTEGAAGRVDRAVITAALACAAVVVGSLLSWVTVDSDFGTSSQSGFDSGDGKITMIAAMLAAVAVFATHRFTSSRRMMLGVAALAALAIGGTALYDTFNVTANAHSFTTDFASAHVGVGLWIVNVAALVMLVGIFFSLRRGSGQASITVELGRPAGVPSQRVESSNVNTISASEANADVEA